MLPVDSPKMVSCDGVGSMGRDRGGNLVSRNWKGQLDDYL